jgi:hypothetical protein
MVSNYKIILGVIEEEKIVSNILRRMNKLIKKVKMSNSKEKKRIKKRIK